MDRKTEIGRSSFDRRWAGLHAAAGGAGRLSVDGDHLMPAFRECVKSRHGEIRRSHIDEPKSWTALIVHAGGATRSNSLNN